ncbi:alpha-ketoglutarate-dependent dioxygenase AlkB family protein [Taibaiella chishuiensis]|uniref:Alkylated DNA repair dioxygenase AlkB n=1 Tax=Taibaiella chishuiensis TaxID=1434707 RepID=A0A2P8D7N1_9BACT|nr:alpha-ketoglutarate-dependent dioxygenase AlkB [Taibaiella chishuiensis]PSK93224.1 alkylated DNA repair dioxygenase AlkB [Taibaiella chishuiensis]
MQQKLFDDDEQLLLPPDLMEYLPAFIPQQQADNLFRLLREAAPWEQHNQVLYEKTVITPRLSAWYGERRSKEGLSQPPIPWLPELLQLKEQVESHTGLNFQGVLLNYYRNEKDSVAWHADKDTLPGRKTEIASVSLGQVRAFDFRKKTDHRQRYALDLAHGSLLLMKGDLQLYWEHRIAKATVPMTGRINLTFRKVAG